MVVVGASDDGWARLTSSSYAAAGQGRRQEWEVEFARYAAPPLRDTSTPPPPGVRCATSATDCHPGSWLPVATPAAVRVSRSSHPSAAPVLTVSVVGVVFEEHFVSILNFSWPQFTCGGQCPGSGSRVVFVSFVDKSKQIQKFALRFPQLSDVESFLNCVKECLGDTMDIKSSGCDYVCEDSSSRSEYIASNELPYSFEGPASDHRTEQPALCYHEESELPVSEPLLPSNLDNINSGFPLSFTEMLKNLSTETEHALCIYGSDAEDLHQLAGTDHPQGVMYGGSDGEDLHQLTGTDHPQEVKYGGSGAEDLHQLTGIDHPQEAFTQDACHDAGSNGNTADKETGTSKSTNEIDTSKPTSDIMARIKKYLADESFHDTLFKVEKIIDELGVKALCMYGSDAEDLHQLAGTDHPQGVMYGGSGAEDLHQLTGTDRPQEVFTQDACHDVGSNGNTADKETGTSKSTKEIDTSKSTSDIMARIKKYLADESFHDMLFKLERIIDELGVDLSVYP
ncbi:hypothetical protein ZWY2020_048832 [Hordeum vulgare]|nr:hypothetical protein ZWY2020_048832 [Hordeum vulgare]